MRPHIEKYSGIGVGLQVAFLFVTICNIMIERVQLSLGAKQTVESERYKFLSAGFPLKILIYISKCTP